ncbi:Retinoblastoma-related protein [Apostasia shenzhenica]|uniref:Retinoblastoma-related protein n=1 Tax=Apostasia shenzhenica TaxID=1088818 RepID=A0A2I0AGX7_9ASPA|nr:Retinoblastoma-related protein [Apostasia shenzhenica]
MEDVKPSVSSCSDYGGAMEARFAGLCKTGLALDESLTRQAMVLLRESKHILLANITAVGSGSPDEAERYWSAFVLYCVVRLGHGKREKVEDGVSLCQILRACKLNIVEFFKEVPQFSLKAGFILSGLYGSDWEKRLGLKELQVNFVHLSALSRHYRRAYQEFFLLSNQSSGSSNSGYISDYHRFGWLLFLALRVHAFSRYKDLVTCTNGLVSILAILILHVPTKFRNFDIKDSRLFARKSDKGIDLLASLCDIYHTSEDELKLSMERTNKLIADILNKKPCPASELARGNVDHFVKDGLTYFDGLLEDESLESSLLALEKDYDVVVSTKGEFDERIFISDDDSVLGTGSLSGGTINLCSRKNKIDVISSPAKTITSPTCPRSPISPINGNYLDNSKMVISTPVSTAMTTAKWLRNIISPLPSKPTAELLGFLSLCEDIINDVMSRANIILGAIFPVCTLERCVQGNLPGARLMDSIWAGQRKTEALKLYYRVLEAICRAESQKLNGNNLTSLLNNERFHRCMLACSAELVLATHKTVTMMFPAVLERTGITAYDLSKVIESFVRHEETLPRELKRHLNSLEERLLESMAWEKGSSMYNSLIVASPSLSTEINRLGLLADPMLSLDAIAVNCSATGGLPPPPFQKQEKFLERIADFPSPKRQCVESKNVLVDRSSFTSPLKEQWLAVKSPKSKLPPLQSAFASPTRPNPAGGGETCAEIGINVFFSKIIKLAAIRIRSLCDRLQLPHEAQERVYCLIQQILSQRTHLLFNRHIDQIILCCFYGVAKISHLDLTFKEIIYSYRRQPHCKPQVFRSVFVNWPSTSHNGKTGEDHVDIITFYNEIFIPSVKPLLVELGCAKAHSKSERTSEDNSTIPESPRLTRFPNLPDMSPKKVSAAHNVYVSPLRSSKMDALLSPSSKSYYACVGESTHAYQSPSKDLSAINNRLNSSRRVSGRLNFDLVSDSIVAGSLGSHSARTDSSASPTIKLEQPDF